MHGDRVCPELHSPEYCTPMPLFRHHSGPRGSFRHQCRRAGHRLVPVGGVAQSGRAPGLHPGGRRFESDHLHPGHPDPRRPQDHPVRSRHAESSGCRRRADSDRQAERQTRRLPPGRPGRRSAASPRRAERSGSGPGRRRDHGLRDADRRAEPQRGPQRGAGGRLPRGRGGHDHRPPVRIGPAVVALRGAGSDGRRLRRGHRGRRGVHDPCSDGDNRPAGARQTVRSPDGRALRP